MRIEHIHIDRFGALSQRDLAPGPGMNLIEGDNESGKTTVASFLRFLFYGFETEEERARAFSATSEQMLGGRALLLASVRGGPEEVYRLERTAGREPGSSCDSVRCFRQSDGEEVFAGSAPWELFLGVSPDLYDSTVFVRQIAPAARIPAGTGIREDALREATGNLVRTGLSSMNAAAAVSALTERQKALFDRETGTGSIADGERTLQRAEASVRELRDQEALTARQSPDPEPVPAGGETDSRLSVLEERRDRLLRMKDAYPRYAALNRLPEYRSLLDRERALNRKADALTEKLFHGNDVPDESFTARLEEDAKTMREAKQDALNAAALSRERVLSSGDDAERAEQYARIENGGGARQIREDAEAFDQTRRVTDVLGVVFVVLFAIALTATLFLYAIGANITSLCAVLTLLFAISAILVFFVRSGNEKKARELKETYGFRDTEEMELTLLRYEQEEGAEGTARAPSSEERKREAVQRYRTAAQDASSLLARLQSEGAEPISPAKLTPEMLERAAGRLRQATAQLSALWREADECGGQARSIAKEYFLDDPDALEEAFAEYRTLFGGKSPEETDPEAIGRELAETEEQILLLSAQADAAAKAEPPQPASPDAPSGNFSRQLFSDSASGKAVVDELEADLREKRRRFYAMTLASEALKQADQSFRGSVTPRLLRHAAAFLRLASDHRYSQLSIGEDGELRCSAPGEEPSVPVQAMSAGMQDAVFLCLRMALCANLFPGRIPPMLYDDAFHSLDGRRLLRVMELLFSVSAESGTQIFVMTSQNRERQAAERIGKPFTVLTL